MENTINNTLNIDDYNINLILNNTNIIDIEQYFKNYHFNYHIDLDISFMNYFLELNKFKNEFVVNANKLEEYGVIDTPDSSKIKRCLKRCFLEEKCDYIILEEKSVSVKTKQTKFI